MSSFAVDLEISVVEKQMQTQLLVFSIEFSHLCEALAGTNPVCWNCGQQETVELVQWVCSWLDVVPCPV